MSNPESDTESHAEDASTPRILLVDDDPDFVFLVRFLLEKEGFQIAQWRSGPVLDTVRATRPDVILLDLLLGCDWRTGVERAIRLADEARPAAVVVVTGYSESSAHEQLHAGGVADVVLKPITPRELALRLRPVFERLGKPLPAKGDATPSDRIA